MEASVWCSCNEPSQFDRSKREALKRLWICEDLEIELPFMFRNPHSFQIAECVSKIWKAYLESIYTLSDLFVV